MVNERKVQKKKTKELFAAIKHALENQNFAK